MRKIAVLQVLFASLACAGEISPADAEIDAAVRKLESDDLKVREAAYESLLAWGKRDPGAVLTRLPESSGDPETIRLCTDLRTRINRKAGWDAVFEKGKRCPGFETDLNDFLMALERPVSVMDGRDVNAFSKLSATAQRSRVPGALDALGDVCARVVAQGLGCSTLRTEALTWLAARKDPRANDAAVRLVEDIALNDKDRQGDEVRYDHALLRAQALGLLGTTKDRRTCDIAIARLKDPREQGEVRDAAMCALWDSGDPRAEEVTLSFLKDADPEIQFLGLQYLQGRRKPGHARHLIEAFGPLVDRAPFSVFNRRNTGIMVYRQFTEMLGEAADPAAIPLLERSFERLSDEKLAEKLGPCQGSSLPELCTLTETALERIKEASGATPER